MEHTHTHALSLITLNPPGDSHQERALRSLRTHPVGSRQHDGSQWAREQPRGRVRGPPESEPEKGCATFFLSIVISCLYFAFSLRLLLSCSRPYSAHTFACVYAVSEVRSQTSFYCRVFANPRRLLLPGMDWLDPRTPVGQRPTLHLHTLSTNPHPVVPSYIHRL